MASPYSVPNNTNTPDRAPDLCRNRGDISARKMYSMRHNSTVLCCHTLKNASRAKVEERFNDMTLQEGFDIL